MTSMPLNTGKPRSLSILVFAAMLLASMGCGSKATDDPLENNLRLAGKNRAQLETVLDYYSQPKDSFKLKAAEFLIINMDAHFTFTSGSGQEMIAQLKKTEGMNDRQANQFIDSIRQDLPNHRSQTKQKKITDLESITSEFLISNIDRAFAVWQNTPWKDNINFSTFCNYILPYKSGNAPIQDWRNTYYSTFASLTDSTTMDSEMKSLADMLLIQGRSQFRYIRNMYVPGDIGALDLLSVNAGQCYEWANTANNLLREFGIPIVTMYTPQWANHRQGHGWNGLVDSSGNVISYSIEREKPYAIDLLRRTTKTAKIFTMPFGKNPNSYAVQAAKKGIEEFPRYLANQRMVDLTRQFVPVSDVIVKISYPSPRHQDFLFLCVFARANYNAIHWSAINDGTAYFTDMGRDVLYLPAYYRNKKYYPAADPVIVSYDGDISLVKLDTSSWKKIRLYRKYPLKPSMFRYTRPFKGMKIQTSEDREFKTPVDRHQISRFPSPVIADGSRERDRWIWGEYLDSVLFHPPLSTQYIRFVAAQNTECIVGEIECFNENGDRVRGEAYGSKEGSENVQDGLYGEAFHDPDSLGWVALSFDKKLTISKIKYLPSNDSNSIQVGDLYELFYWDKEWISLGRQVAENKYLDYSVPKGALLFLSNLDGGVEERPFTIDPVDNKQVWW